MSKCNFYQIIFQLFPLSPIRDWAIHHHLGICPRCQQNLAKREKVLSLLWLPQRSDRARLFWSKIEPQLKLEKPLILRRPQLRLRPTLALASLSLILMITSLFFIFTPFKKKTESKFSSSQELLQIIHFQVKDKPVAPVIYKPFGSNLIFIWAQSPNNNSIL